MKHTKEGGPEATNKSRDAILLTSARDVLAGTGLGEEGAGGGVELGRLLVRGTIVQVKKKKAMKCLVLYPRGSSSEICRES